MNNVCKRLICKLHHFIRIIQSGVNRIKGMNLSLYELKTTSINVLSLLVTQSYFCD